ncbi:uncharacterized protein BJX67DRAFT_376815 [Aspergillus lucknowensis]|uniref:Uncharacterized protein n=1 Tax=Aspergillus lucknowensis TaxID=176173 RepID=A0ABR4M5S6_9EURO
MTTVMTDKIGKDLDMDGWVVWITSACLLTSGGFVLPFGTLAAFAASWAPDGPSLIVFTTLIGLFSAAAVTPAVGQPGAVYNGLCKRRNRAFACFSAGTFIAGVVLEVARRVRWRACFWVFSVLCAEFGALVAFTVPSDERVFPSLPTTTRVSGWEVLKRFDLFGAELATVGVSASSAGLTLAGVASKEWGTPYVVALLVVGVVLLGIFIFWQSVYKFP